MRFAANPQNSFRALSLWIAVEARAKILAAIAMRLSNVILGSTMIWPTWIKVLFVLVCLGVLAVVAAFIFMIVFLLKEYFSKRKK